MLCYAIMVHSSHCIEVHNSLSRCFDNWLEFHPLFDYWFYLIPRESILPGYLSDFMDIFDFDIFCISCVYIIGGKKILGIELYFAVVLLFVPFILLLVIFSTLIFLCGWPSYKRGS